MTKEIQEFLERLANDPNFDFEEVVKQAHEILREEFKNKVLDTFSSIKEDWYSSGKEIREAILKDNKAKFIYECYYSHEKRNFINDNFGKLDEMLVILKEYITEEVEEEEANE